MNKPDFADIRECALIALNKFPELVGDELDLTEEVLADWRRFIESAQEDERDEQAREPFEQLIDKEEDLRREEERLQAWAKALEEEER